MHMMKINRKEKELEGYFCRIELLEIDNLSFQIKVVLENENQHKKQEEYIKKQ